MPRKRKAARAFRKTGPVSRRVAAIFSDDFALYISLQTETFHIELPVPAERAVFARLFPDRFIELCHFEYSDIDEYPASVGFETNVFCREGFAGFLRTHEVDLSTTFEMPDLFAVPYIDRLVVLARARAAWWAKNKLPETVKEGAWRDADFIGGSLTAVANKFSSPEHQSIESAFLAHRRGYRGKEKLT
jgi:hypothetical protein